MILTSLAQLLCFLLLTTCTTLAAEQPPNVILIFAGDKNSDIENGKIKPGAPPAQLYDLENDLQQTRNLYNEYPKVVQEMKALLTTYRPTQAPLEKQNRNRKRKENTQ